MKQNVVREKSFQLALAIIEQTRKLEERHEYILSKQLLRAGTSIGANICESISAESTKDFLHKLQIALKEGRETRYWIELLSTSQYKNLNNYTILAENTEEIIRLLVAITKKLKDKTNS